MARSAPSRLRYGLPGATQKASKPARRAASSMRSLASQSKTRSTSSADAALASASGIARCAAIESSRSPTIAMFTSVVIAAPSPRRQRELRAERDEQHAHRAVQPASDRRPHAQAAARERGEQRERVTPQHAVDVEDRAEHDEC